MLGLRFGKLVVTDRAPNKGKRAMWVCRCDCGKRVTRLGKYLRSGEVKSCGCLHRQPMSGPRTTHGHSIGKISRTYSTWASMVQRCTNPKSTTWSKYGGKGITVCKRWLSFDNFLSDMGERPAGMSIDRINPRGSYTRSNCRWADSKQQGANQTKTRFITFQGRTLHLTAWAGELGINPSTLHGRLKRWPAEIAMTKKRGWAFRRK